MAQELPPGTAVMVDANVLVYHFADDPVFGKACSRLLGMAQDGDIVGHTTATILGEMMHALMIVEVVTRHGAPPSRALSLLRRKKGEVAGLSLYSRALTSVLESALLVHGLAPRDLREASRQVATHGLLTNDSLTLAAMKHLGIRHLATNDDDFDAVNWITVWKPR